MANCTNCAAPLPSKTTLCPYCHTQNSTDLRGFTNWNVASHATDRKCPECEQAMETIAIDLMAEADDRPAERVEVERCAHCQGMFFDPGELEYLIEQSVQNVFQIDLDRIQQVNRELSTMGTNRYRRCPVCNDFMQYKCYGTKSGVIIDWCRNHGTWLDGGELRHLLEWAKAGGRELDQQTQIQREQERLRQQYKPKAVISPDIGFGDGSAGSPLIGHRRSRGYGLFDDAADGLGDLLARGIMKLFG